MPIPDFRTLESQEVSRPSPNLLDVLYNCQERQSWYRENVRINQQQERPFVGSASLQMEASAAADSIRNTLGFGLDVRSECRTWEDALRLFIQKSGQAGILIMVSGVVLSNNKRKLNVKEFRGSALSDPLAPLVFVNGSDTKSGQIFYAGPRTGPYLADYLGGFQCKRRAATWSQERRSMVQRCCRRVTGSAGGPSTHVAGRRAPRSGHDAFTSGF